MKKFLKTILFLCALSSIAYAEDDAAKVLDKMRDKIEKEDGEVLTLDILDAKNLIGVKAD